ncbi:MAG: response regulator [Rhodospirillales bacterium]|nr:response regulator [Rhodospirillales bacterium]MCW8862602.1 response regulator [Rhodospirillales bacterium]MCW8951772.1 response regulator [Rhodospirillales bacterium]MCW9002168.1 response regulator [Rhodospirillales bacterium]MCW9039305.1 response regulator [Rhodospirillales bacterium]
MPYDLSGLNVLIVDDNSHMRTLVKEILRAFGIRNPHEATDGADALKELRIYAADIVICDIHMEPLNGIEFVQMIRTAKDSANPYVPIIMLTGHTEATEVYAARDAGATEFIGKPVSATQLYRRLIEVIEHPRPFVKTRTYMGPDRRRREIKNYSGSERRKSQHEYTKF